MHPGPLPLTLTLTLTFGRAPRTPERRRDRQAGANEQGEKGREEDGGELGSLTAVVVQDAQDAATPSTAALPATRQTRPHAPPTGQRKTTMWERVRLLLGLMVRHWRLVLIALLGLYALTRRRVRQGLWSMLVGSPALHGAPAVGQAFDPVPGQALDTVPSAPELGADAGFAPAAEPGLAQPLQPARMPSLPNDDQFGPPSSFPMDDDDF